MVFNKKPPPPVMRKPNSGTQLNELESSVKPTIPGEADNFTPPGTVKENGNVATGRVKFETNTKPVPGKLAISAELAGAIGGNFNRKQDSPKKEKRSSALLEKLKQASIDEGKKAPKLANMVDEVRDSLSKDDDENQDGGKKPVNAGIAGLLAREIKEKAEVKRAGFAGMVDTVKASIDKEDEVTNKRKGFAEMVRASMDTEDESQDAKKKSGFAALVDTARRASLDKEDESKESKDSKTKRAGFAEMVRASIDKNDEAQDEGKAKRAGFAAMVDEVRRASVDQEEKTEERTDEKGASKPRLAGMVARVQSQDSSSELKSPRLAEMVEKAQSQSLEKDETKDPEPTESEAPVQKKKTLGGMMAVMRASLSIDEPGSEADQNSGLGTMIAKVKQHSLEREDEIDVPDEKTEAKAKLAGAVDKIKSEKTKNPMLGNMADVVRASLEKQKSDEELNADDTKDEKEKGNVDETEKDATAAAKKKGIAGIFSKIRRKSIEALDAVKPSPKLADVVQASIDKEDEKKNDEKAAEETEERDTERKDSKAKFTGMIEKIRRKSVEELEKVKPKLAQMVDEVRAASIDKEDEKEETEKPAADVDDETKTKESEKKSKLSGMISKIRKSGRKDDKPKMAGMVETLVKHSLSIDPEVEPDLSPNGKSKMLKYTTLPLGASVMNEKDDDVDSGDGLKERRNSSVPNLVGLEKPDKFDADEDLNYRSLPRVLDGDEKKKQPSTKHHTLPRASKEKEMPPLIKPKMEALIEDDVTEPAPDPCCQKLPFSEELLFGSVQIIVAVLLILVGIIGIITKSKYGYVSYRIWGAAIFIVAGGLGIGTRIHLKSENFILTTMTFAIAAIVMAGAGIAVDYFAYLADNERSTDTQICLPGIKIDETTGEREKKCQDIPLWEQRVWHVALHYLSMTLFGIQAVVSFVFTVFCCRRVCCIPEQKDAENLEYTMNVSPGTPPPSEKQKENVDDKKEPVVMTTVDE